jgi:hypothetical protein
VPKDAAYLIRQNLAPRLVREQEDLRLPLFIDKAGYPELVDDVETDLMAIFAGAVVSFLAYPADDTVLEVNVSSLYDTTASFLPDISATIIIHPVYAESEIGNGIMAEWAGYTYPPDLDNRIHIFYDVTQCNGAGYWVPAIGGGGTIFPNYIILFHELAHAYHYATQTVAPNIDVQGAADENQIRQRDGMLPLRDPNALDRGNCGRPPPPPPTPMNPTPTERGSKFLCGRLLSEVFTGGS